MTPSAPREPSEEFWIKCLDEAEERFKEKFARITKQSFILGCGYGYGAARADFTSALTALQKENEINRQAAQNGADRLNRANERIVEFEDIKKGHLEFVKSLEAKLAIAVDDLEHIERSYTLSGERMAHQDFAKKTLSKIKGVVG